MIRKAENRDVSRIAEILVYNNRLVFFPIFQDEAYSFGEMQVLSVAEEFLKDEEMLSQTFVFDEKGIVKGLIRVCEEEIVKLYVDPFFHGRGIGRELIQFAKEECGASYLWALEKNERALRFYRRNGFEQTGERKLEEGTEEYLVKLALNIPGKEAAAACEI